MKSPHTDDTEVLDLKALDIKSSRSIRDAVGERLQQILRAEPAAVSPHLERLVEELRRRDDAGTLRSR